MVAFNYSLKHKRLKRDLPSSWGLGCGVCCPCVDHLNCNCRSTVSLVRKNVPVGSAEVYVTLNLEFTLQSTMNTIGPPVCMLKATNFFSTGS